MVGRAGKLLVSLLILVVLSGWAALRLIGWPLVKGPSPYQVVANWPRLPAGLTLGQVSGLAVNSQGQVFVFARGQKVWESDLIDPAVITTPTVFSFDGQTGELLKAWGDHRFVMPHGLTIDQADNIWLTDVGLHQVYALTATAIYG